jgi:hypothetical protein
MSESLHSYLRERAGSRGLVHIREEALLAETGLTREQLVDGLGALERARAIRILSPLPFLALRVRKWSDIGRNAAESQHSSYSYSKLSQLKLLNESNSYSAKTSDPLLAEILDVLGETDGSHFTKVIELYSPHVIRAALERVRRTRNIRKNRTALFRYLLTTIS